MGDPALDLAAREGIGESSLTLRLAQRAFAALIEDAARFGAFRAARLRTGAARALSALSADDRGAFARWLALQLATLKSDRAAPLAVLTTLDAAFATRVRGLVPSVVSEIERKWPFSNAVSA